MFRNFKFLLIFLTTFFSAFLVNNVFAQEQSSSEPKEEEAPYAGPKVSGSILYQIQADHIMSSNQRKDVKGTNGFVYIEPNIGLHFDQNWSLKTQWRIQDNNTLTTRDKNNPERYRTFFNSERGFNVSDTGLLIEELKLFYENEDMKFTLGKFDPTFGSAHRKSKRIGVFASQITEDYNLREKIGGSITALLEGGQLSFSTFFSDATDLSRSAINDRKKEIRNNGLAGNTGSLSSYSLQYEGEDFAGVENWFYNLGYRSLGVDQAGRKRETGYVVGTEYLHKVSSLTSLIPFAELVRIQNFGGENKRVGNYYTFAMIGKYSSWTASTSLIIRNIKRPHTNIANLKKSSNDRQLQFSIGYKFTDNLTVDVSRALIREDGFSGGVFGGNINYLYKF